MRASAPARSLGVLVSVFSLSLAASGLSVCSKHDPAGDAGTPDARTDGQVGDGAAEGSPGIDSPSDAGFDSMIDASMTDAGGDGSKKAFGTLAFLPPDRTSAWLSSPDRSTIGIMLTLTRAIDEVQLTDVVSGLAVQTYPEMDEVATDLAIPGSGAGDGGLGDGLPAGTHSVLLEPKAALDERLYIVRIKALPDWLSWTFPAFKLDLAAGASGARFLVGSAPKLWAIALCEGGKAPTDWKVRVYLTEPVLSSAGKGGGELTTVRQDGKSVSCSVTEEPSGSTASDTIALSCGLFGVASKLSIDLVPGLVSPTGVPVRDADGKEGFAYSFVPETLPKAECYWFIPS